MARSAYPIVTKQDDFVNFAKEITRIREIEDVPDFTNLNKNFVSGQTTTRVPSSPSDVLATDTEGDIVTDGTNGFEYTLIDVSSTLTWDRRTLNFAW